MCCFGIDFDCFNDPSWGEFKSCVSLLVKKAKNLIDRASMSKSCELYGCASCVIDELIKKFESVPEDIPGDVKHFVMGIIGMLYGCVPSDEVIISRFGKSMGSPNLMSSNPVIDFATVSWIDLLVNLKTNLTSIKNYCDTKTCSDIIDNDTLNNSECPVSGKNSLASMIAIKQNRILNQNIGGSLFEAMMIGFINECSNIAMESSMNVDDATVENAALIETLMHYTVFETLDTLGIYKFRLGDINNIKKGFVRSVNESATPINKADDLSGNTPKQTLGLGKDKSGKKKIRIKTGKMRVSGK